MRLCLQVAEIIREQWTGIEQQWKHTEGQLRRELAKGHTEGVHAKQVCGRATGLSMCRSSCRKGCSRRPRCTHVLLLCVPLCCF